MGRRSRYRVTPSLLPPSLLPPPLLPRGASRGGRGEGEGGEGEGEEVEEEGGKEEVEDEGEAAGATWTASLRLCWVQAPAWRWWRCPGEEVEMK